MPTQLNTTLTNDDKSKDYEINDGTPQPNPQWSRCHDEVEG